MTIFNLNGSGGVWFDLEGGGRVQLRSMDADTLKAIRKQTVKTRIEYKRVEGKAERFEVEQADEDLQNALFWDHVIVAWENLFDANNAAIPCTRENKILLLSKSVRFATFIADSLKVLADGETAQTEEAEANLSRG